MKFTIAILFLLFSSSSFAQKSSRNLGIQNTPMAEIENFLPDPLSGWTEVQHYIQKGKKRTSEGVSGIFKKYAKGKSLIKVTLITKGPYLPDDISKFGGFMKKSEGEVLKDRWDKKGILTYDSVKKVGSLKNLFPLKIKGKNVEKKDLIFYFKAVKI